MLPQHVSNHPLACYVIKSFVLFYMSNYSWLVGPIVWEEKLMVVGVIGWFYKLPAHQNHASCICGNMEVGSMVRHVGRKVSLSGTLALKKTTKKTTNLWTSPKQGTTTRVETSLFFKKSPTPSPSQQLPALALNHQSSNDHYYTLYCTGVDLFKRHG